MSKSIYQTAWINLLPKLKKRHLFKSPWGLGEIKHTIIIISISFHGWRCIMIPHADFVLTLAIIGMSKLLYICTQIKPTKLNSHILFIKWIAIIAFFTNCSFFVFGNLLNLVNASSWVKYGNYMRPFIHKIWLKQTWKYVVIAKTIISFLILYYIFELVLTLVLFNAI